MTLIASHNLMMEPIGFDLDKDGGYKAAFVKRVMDGKVGEFK